MMIEKVRFLVVRFSSIGDIVLTTPVVRALKQQVECAEVHFLTKEKYRQVIEANPYIDKIHVLKEDFTALIDELKNEYFDYIIDLHRNLRTSRVKSKLKLVSFSFDKLNKEKWLMVNFKRNKLPNVHIVERYLKALSVFDVQSDQAGLDYFYDEKDQLNPLSISKKLEQPYLAFVIGATFFTKRLPETKIIEIIEHIEHPIVLLGGPEEHEIAERVAVLFPDKVFNTCGKYNLNQSASLVEQSRLVISNDTGLMHIAAAFSKPIFSLWGNTIPEFGMYPYKPNAQSRIFEVSDLACRPCSKLGFSACPKKHFNCMMNLNSSEISNEANRILSEISTK